MRFRSCAIAAVFLHLAASMALSAPESAAAESDEVSSLRLRVLALEQHAAGLELQLRDALRSSDVPDGRRLLAAGGGRTTIVFNMGTDVSVGMVSLVMLCIIVLTVAIEKLVHFKDHHLPEAYLPIINKFEEEFMIMGAVSFVIVIVEVSVGVTHAQLLNIEFAHLLLFFAALMLLAFALKQLVSMAECQAHWDRLERCDKAKLLSSLNQQEGETRQLQHRVGRAVYSFFRPFAEFDAKESAEHLIMRKVFCDAFQLRSCDERGLQFDFSLYLRRSLSEIVCLGFADRWECAYCTEDQPYVESSDAYLQALLATGWGLLGLRLLLVLWIRHIRSRFLRKHAQVDGREALARKLAEQVESEAGRSSALEGESPLDAVRRSMAGALRASSAGLPPATEATAASRAKASLSEADYLRADANGDGVIDKDEFRVEAMRRQQQAAAGHRLTAPVKQHVANIFDEARHKQLRRKRVEAVRSEQRRLSEGVWTGDRPAAFLYALGVVRILEAWYVALVLLNGVTTAALVLGPNSWWLILLLCAPPVVSLQLATLIVRDFALMYAITIASADTLMQVEHHSATMQRSYEELRDQFQRMFLRAHPTKDDILEACFEAFVAHDTDSSGRLSHKEFSVLVAQLTGEEASSRMMRRLLRMMDTDQSGEIEVEEFLRFAAPLEDELESADFNIEELEHRIEQMAGFGRDSTRPRPLPRARGMKGKAPKHKGGRSSSPKPQRVQV